MGVLVSISDTGLGRKFILGDECLIGRSSECAIQVLDGLVSKRHARIHKTESGFALEDLGSKNGVSINGVRVAGSRVLAANDVIAIGEIAFLFDPKLDVLPIDGSEQAVIVVDDGALPDAALTRAAHAPSDPINLALPDLGGSLSELLVWLQRRIPCTTAGLMATTPRGLEAVCLASTARTVSLPKSLLDSVLASGKAVCLPDARPDTSFVGGKTSTASTLRSLLAAPLTLAGKTVGVVFFHDERRGAYTDAHMQELVRLAPLVALLLSLFQRQHALQDALARATPAPATEAIIGEAPAWREVKALITKAAAAPSPVLIQGESGTGKELVARALHRGSAASGAFIAINCGAIPEALMESELFGYEKGAFTGAARRTLGKLEAAKGGTLFLDEIGDLPLALQVKLLRVLQERELYRLGGVTPVAADFRVVAATHRDLKAMIAAGAFREDLYYRLNVIQIVLPPLREHADDVPALVEHLIAALNKELHTRVQTLTPAALNALRRYPWPGNVRELRNVLERAMVLCEEQELGVDALPPEITTAHGQPDAPPEATLPRQIEVLEKRLLIAALKRARGKKVAAARALGISRPTLDKKIKDHAIDLFAEDDA